VAASVARRVSLFALGTSIENGCMILLWVADPPALILVEVEWSREIEESSVWKASTTWKQFRRLFHLRLGTILREECEQRNCDGGVQHDLNKLESATMTILVYLEEKVFVDASARNSKNVISTCWIKTMDGYSGVSFERAGPRKKSTRNLK
jgi:hypothetical protein